MTAGVDGRTARAMRTRQAVVDAFLQLLAEGEPCPPAKLMAARAGVSVRALWANFTDLENLYAAAGQRQIERQAAIARRIDPRLPLPDRVAALCRQRARVLEFLTPVARAAQLREPFSPQLRADRSRQYQIARDELARVFAPELDAAGPGGSELLHALTAATTWPVWSALRDHLGLSVAAARRVMSRTVGALLGL